MIKISINKTKNFTPENFKKLPILSRLAAIICLKFLYREKTIEICKFLVVSRKSIYNWNKLLPKECKNDFYRTKSFFKSQKVNIVTKKSSKNKNSLQIEINVLENKAYEIICFGSNNVIENKEFKYYLFNGYTTNSLAKETSKSVSTIGRYRKELLDNSLAEKQNTLATYYIQKKLYQYKLFTQNTENMQYEWNNEILKSFTIKLYSDNFSMLTIHHILNNLKITTYEKQHSFVNINEDLESFLICLFQYINHDQKEKIFKELENTKKIKIAKKLQEQMEELLYTTDTNLYEEDNEENTVYLKHLIDENFKDSRNLNHTLYENFYTDKILNDTNIGYFITYLPEHFLNKSLVDILYYLTKKSVEKNKNKQGTSTVHHITYNNSSTKSNIKTLPLYELKKIIKEFYPDSNIKNKKLNDRNTEIINFYNQKISQTKNEKEIKNLERKKLLRLKKVKNYIKKKLKSRYNIFYSKRYDKFLIKNMQHFKFTLNSNYLIKKENNIYMTNNTYYIALDTEYVNINSGENKLLSWQCCISLDGKTLSKGYIKILEEGEPRPKLQDIIPNAFRDVGIPPEHLNGSHIVIICHYCPAELAMLSEKQGKEKIDDLKFLLKNMEYVRKTVISLKEQKYSITHRYKDEDQKIKTCSWSYEFFDTKLIAPAGASSLNDLSKSLSDKNLHKKDMNFYEISHMDWVLKHKRKKFKEYAINDAKATLKGFLELQNKFNELENIEKKPTKQIKLKRTIGGAALSYYKSYLSLTYKKRLNDITGKDSSIEELTKDKFSESYHGGRNETYFIGKAPEEYIYFDIDYKCQVQTKNAPICSVKVHHLVTPIY